MPPATSFAGPSCSAGARPSPFFLQGRRSARWGAERKPPAIARAAEPASQAAPAFAAPTATATTTSAHVGISPSARPPTLTTFEPRADPSAAFVLAVVGAAAAYWWNGVVPAARRSLAADKRKGSGAQYLERLQADAASGERKGEAWFYTDWLRALEKRQAMARRGVERRRQVAGEGAGRGAAAAAVSAAAAGAAAERGSPGLRPSSSSPAPAGGKRETEEGFVDDGFSVPPDREPFFWSLDNPIVATAAFVAVGSAVATAARALG